MLLKNRYNVIKCIYINESENNIILTKSSKVLTKKVFFTIYNKLRNKIITSKKKYNNYK